MFIDHLDRDQFVRCLCGSLYEGVRELPVNIFLGVRHYAKTAVFTDGLNHREQQKGL